MRRDWDVSRRVQVEVQERVQSLPGLALEVVVTYWQWERSGVAPSYAFHSRYRGSMVERLQ